MTTPNSRVTLLGMIPFRWFLLVFLAGFVLVALMACTELRVAELVWSGSQSAGYIFTPDRPFVP